MGIYEHSEAEFSIFYLIKMTFVLLLKTCLLILKKFQRRITFRVKRIIFLYLI